jgi:cell division protein FtsB
LYVQVAELEAEVRAKAQEARELRAGQDALQSEARALQGQLAGVQVTL